MVTTFLATVIGWYLIITCLFVLLKYEQIKPLVAEVLASRGQFMVLAVFTIIMGLLLVASHNIWVMGWPVIITIFSWMVLISGIMRLYFPEIAIDINHKLYDKPVIMKVVCVIFIVIGVYLLLHVYYF